MIARTKLAVYVDETGQDTRGRFFLVSVVLTESSSLDDLRVRLTKLERTSKKGKKKWRQTRPVQRIAYLVGLPPILTDIAPVYWRSYPEGTDYSIRTAEATLAAMNHRDPAGTAQLTVIVDGLNWKERATFARVFRSHRRKWHKLTGGRDEADPLLRLTDALAGFLRDLSERNPSAITAWAALKRYFHEV